MLFKEGRGGIHNLLSVVDELCVPESYSSVVRAPAHHDVFMPSGEELAKCMSLLQSIIFPGYFIHSELKIETMKFYIGSTLDRVIPVLNEQIKRGFCFDCGQNGGGICHDCEVKAHTITHELIKALPEIRRLLSLDAKAAYKGDPAARGVGETIFCYPSITALTHHRIAHELYKFDVPLIPRIIAEMAHSRTGIDIHPGATIGESFFIDHGTGTVIGETCVIGKNVQIYQGVTLGAKSFPLDDSGRPIKGIPRHPIVEENVTIYSGATILGRITIGKGAEIGGNVWITEDIPPGTKVTQQKAREVYFAGGLGI